MRVNGKEVIAIRRNGKDFVRVAKGGIDLWTSNALPIGFTALEYVQSSGTQYVDTGFKHNNNTRVVMDVQATGITANAWAFEGRDSTGSAAHGIFYYYGSTKLWTGDNGGSDNRLSFDGIGATDRLSIDYDKNVCTINGVENTFTEKAFQSSYNLTLLAANTTGNVAGFLSAKLYSCKIYDNDVLVRNFVPCMNASSVCGLYDRVNKVFYPSASSTALLPPDGTEGTMVVGDRIYRCEQGMTWGAWVSSSYNTGGYYVSGTQINDSTGNKHVDGVTTTDTINVGTTFSLVDNVSITWTTVSGTWNSKSSNLGKDGTEWTCVSPGSSGSTVIQCTFRGVTSITFTCEYNGENNFDYLTVGSLDSACTRDSYGTTLKGRSGYQEDITFSCTSEQHYVQFCYSKDGSVDTSPDNATVYVKTYS